MLLRAPQEQPLAAAAGPCPHSSSNTRQWLVLRPPLLLLLLLLLPPLPLPLQLRCTRAGVLSMVLLLPVSPAAVLNTMLGAWTLR